MRAGAATLALPCRHATARPRTAGWGRAEWFAIAQTAIPAVLFLPGTQGVRLYVRVASFAISIGLLGWWAASSRRRSVPHPSQRWVIAATGYVALMLVHPLTSSPLAGVAQLVLYAAVAAPLLWAPALVRTPDHLARVMGVLLVCNGANAVVGVLQVYDPSRWMPQEMSRIVTASDLGLGAVSYMGPHGLIVRPPGLFDNPGAVAGPGMYAALLGLVFAMSAMSWWKRALALAASGAGVAAIYLSQVRVSLVVLAVMIAGYALVLTLQNRRARAAVIAAVAAAVIVATFTFAILLGGDSIARRTFSLFEQDPITLYSASRGGQLVYTYDDLLSSYPLGAGLGRWGMIAGYFGSSDPASQPLWAEIQVAGWAIDGGLPLLVLSFVGLAVTLVSQLRLARHHPDARVRACAAVVFAGCLGTAALVFSFTPFVTQIGLQFWFLAGALHGVAGRTGERA
jgi:hypothetical protein